MVDNLDILPTVLDVCGVEYPVDMDLPGESLLRGARGTRDRTVHYAENGGGLGRWCSLRGERWKYTYYFRGGREEMFDLQNDPDELVDVLAGEPTSEQRAARDMMRAKLTAYEARYGLSDTRETGELRPCTDEPPKPWLPRNDPGCTWQFHMHPFNMTAEEAARYTSEADEVFAVTAKEPTTVLGRLNLDYYESAGGDPDVRRRMEQQDAE
jgi:hypothetical protein